MNKTPPRLFLLIGIGLVGLYALYLFQQIPLLSTNDQIARLEIQIRDLQHENEKLEIELARYTGLEHIDAEAAKLGLIRPQQVRFILQNDLSGGAHDSAR